jgi:pimeloyl-ACP methyl ester carboxylesterase
MTTVDTARDMDSIRQALGQSQISYYGFSYGTYLGQVYSTLFPSHVRRLIMDSNVDPRKVWYQANLDQDIAFNRNIKIWFGWLAQHHLLPPGPGPRRRWKTASRGKARLFNTPSRLGRPGRMDRRFPEPGYYEETWLQFGRRSRTGPTRTARRPAPRS